MLKRSIFGRERMGREPGLPAWGGIATKGRSAGRDACRSVDKGVSTSSPPGCRTSLSERPQGVPRRVPRAASGAALATPRTAAGFSTSATPADAYEPATEGDRVKLSPWRSSAIRGPVVHQVAAAFEHVRPRERRFCPVGHRVRLRRFDDLAPVISLVGRPVAKARPEAVQLGCDGRPRDEPPGSGSGGSWLV